MQTKKQTFSLTCARAEAAKLCEAADMVIELLYRLCFWLVCYVETSPSADQQAVIQSESAEAAQLSEVAEMIAKLSTSSLILACVFC